MSDILHKFLEMGQCRLNISEGPLMRYTLSLRLSFDLKISVKAAACVNDLHKFTYSFKLFVDI